jgi:hypothetical protein
MEVDTMPRGDGTGPNCFGPMTGRGLGFCAGYDNPGFVQPGFGGRGYGRGFRSYYGYGRGMRRGFAAGAPAAPWGVYAYPQYTEEDEKNMLKEEADFLRERLDSVEKRLSDMEEKDES